MAARPAQAGLERHEDPGRGRAARDALAVEQLNARDDAPPQTHVLGQRPARQQGRQPLPERAVMAVAEPCGAVDGLEFDKGQQGGDGGGGFGEQVAGDDEVERVVHGGGGDRGADGSQAQVLGRFVERGGGDAALLIIAA